MKKMILITLSLLMASFCISSHADEYLDQIVAVVNDDVVTKSELNRSLSLAKLQMAQEHGNAPSASTLQKQVLDQLINKKLQLQIAQQVGIHFDDEEVDRIVANLAGKNNISVADLYRRINSEGMSTNEYRKELREQMTIQKLQQQQVASRIVVSPDEITAFMHSRLWQNNSNKEYHLEDILISLSDTPSSEEITKSKKHAQSVLTELQQGKKLAEIEGIASNDLGWRKLPEIPSAFAEHITSMKTNDVAGPIRAGNGFHIIRLVADRSSGSAENTPNRTQVEQLLMQRKFQENVQHWVSKMRSQAFITKNMTT
jgi:peptidyl-prolyl cis-trans isomerase SurA